MPTLLDEHLLRDSLGALAGWTGTTDRIERTVQLPADQDAELRARVQEASDSLDHHAVIESSGGGTRFALWTHSEGGVTELDIALASRISDLLRQVTGDPKPIGRPRQDGVAVTADGVPLPGDDAGGAPRDRPTMGVPAGSSGTPQVPLPDAEPGGPEPGATPEQEPGPLTGR